MTSHLLDSIHSPADLSALSYDELDKLAAELREKMVAVTSLCGGHLASSLGAVEAIIALHRVLNCPEDKLVFDVGHQAYAHKLLTGRNEQFSTLRRLGGLSGFPKINESPYDAHDSGHASDALSIALGYALARDYDKGDQKIVAFVGDAAFTGGMSLEALNIIGQLGTSMIIVLNDNGMSISRSVGAFASHLGKMRMSKEYTTLRESVKVAVGTKGRLGRFLMDTGGAFKDSFKQLVLPSGMFFEQFGAMYVGPVDGHDIKAMEEIFIDAASVSGPVVVHILTNKGQGYEPAKKHPDLFHGVGPFDVKTGKSISVHDVLPSWTQVFSDELLRCAQKNERIIAITAAMRSGTGLDAFAKKYPERFFDVGIAEENAVCMAASLALGANLPLVAIYSTFLQRAYDQIMINVALQNQHVVFCVDRAGLVGEDGPTHHGAFDLSYLRTIPNMCVLAPSDAKELACALRYALEEYTGPVALRYPRGPVMQDMTDASDITVISSKPYPYPRQLFTRQHPRAAILCCGRMLAVGLDAARLLHDKNVDVDVYDMRCVKPLNEEALFRAASCGCIFTLEDNSVVGGFGSAVLESLTHLKFKNPPQVTCLGLPDDFVGQGKISELFSQLGLDAPSVARRIYKALC